jgi:hypothetical protein
LLKMNVRMKNKWKMEHKGFMPQWHEDEEGEQERVAAEGMLGEGERIPLIIEQMEREDKEVVLVEMEGDDSDEGDAVPVEWSQTGFDAYEVADS